MARKDRINQKPLIIPPHPPLLIGDGGELLIFDVNITTEKVNEKNPLEVLIKRPVPRSEDGPLIQRPTARHS
jgi:hypothetical protein